MILLHLKKKQLEDPDIGPVLKWLASGARPVGPQVPASSPATWHYWLYWKSFKIMDGILFCKLSRKDGTEQHIQLIVPRKLKDEIMYQMYESLPSGHLGKCKTREQVIQHFYSFGVERGL